MNPGNGLVDIGSALSVLERTPASLRALLEGLPEMWTRATEGEGTWTPYDVVGHLIHGERTNWMVRARHILAGRADPFPPFDRTAMLADSQATQLAELLSRFDDLRRANLEELRSLDLTSNDLKRTSAHPDFGAVTLGQLLATWVVHDLDHVVQVARTMAKAYSAEVGPWRAYLSVLRDRE